MANTRPLRWARSGKRAAPWTARLRRSLAAPLAILAILIQCVVVQGHIDIPASRLSAAVVATSAPAAPAAAVDEQQKPGNLLGGCLICQQVALAGGIVLGVSATLPLAQAGAFRMVAIQWATILRHPRSHAWQSRAPPPRI